MKEREEYATRVQHQILYTVFELTDALGQAGFAVEEIFLRRYSKWFDEVCLQFVLMFDL